MIITVTGNYDTTYNRTIILLEGLKKKPGVKLVEIPFKDNINTSKLKDYLNQSDIIYLPPFTHADVRKVRKLTSKPIVFDPLISKYLTKVFDYKLVWKYSPRAIKNYFKDWIAFRNCDCLIADTMQHKHYFSEKFSFPLEKIHVVPIGVDCRHFYPVENLLPNSAFKVGFYGGFIPLQGVTHVVETAAILKNEHIEFHLVGNGFEFDKVKNLAKNYRLSNVYFHGWLPYQQLNEILNSFDLCLGIFGNTPKADMVIPNKIFHYAAVKKCIITKDTPAIREIFTPGNDIVVTKSDASEIAANIVKMQNDKTKRESIAENCFWLVCNNFNEDKIAEKFLETIINQFR